MHADGVISIGGIITRGATLHDSLRDIVAEFAKRNGLDNMAALDEYYSPTMRQRELIETAAARRGSFAAGWAHVFVADKFGEATTHWRKLEDRVRRGVGNPCPLLLVGLPRDIVE